MKIQWLSKKSHATVTIYETNLTLNTSASDYFKNASTTVVGYNEEKDSLVIKPLSLDETQNGEFSNEDFHPIAIKSTYGRINGTDLVKNLSSFHKLDFKSKPNHKFKCLWDKDTNSLIVDLKEEIN